MIRYFGGSAARSAGKQFIAFDKRGPAPAFRQTLCREISGDTAAYHKRVHVYIPRQARITPGAAARFLPYRCQFHMRYFYRQTKIYTAKTIMLPFETRIPLAFRRLRI